MAAKAKAKSFLRSIHLQALAFLVIYTVLSKTIFIKAIINSNIMVSFLVPYLFGVLAGIVFLYLFNHEDFFHFVKEVEYEERKKEKRFLKKYLRFGKIISVLIIGSIGGPIFSALTTRFLLNRVWYRYLIIALANIPSTLLALAMGKSALGLIAIV